MNQDTLKWLETLGGPFLLLATDKLRHWQGNDGDEADYLRICKVNDPIDLIEVGDATSLVLAETLRTTWVAPRGLRPGMFVGWRYSNSELDVVSGLKQIPVEIFNNKPLRLTIKSRSHRLFDSVYAGSSTEKEGFLKVNLKPGNYEAQAGEHKPDPHTSLLITRLVRLDD